ncbi:anaerobic sulfatase maturase [Paenibacillus sp. KQZ6P-2]|uniref:Anaerobic sulfatase maturase n=1 Tax=Paenibacillus mangrovi TaxID=2931978 RepID=A0A9X1WK48_9BACL|nr:anaerobic sulfatase maturase [Paenibacillus mangrovi]MCJ8010807.1 anaerobic sulfatase maturase [Paenibacillus mangrovi]
MESSCSSSVGRSIGVLWKTVSEDCNLACDYCYFSTCGGKPGKTIRKIDPTLLEKFIQEYMALSNGVASFAWQGGEPLLAGLDFFKEVIALQAKYAPPNTIISNSLQTNGTLIHERWAEFFKKYNFLIGVSLDGPQEIHDQRRLDSRGNGSFDKVMNGISHLRRHQVDFNILTVIHKGNVGKSRELFRFYQQENFGFVQFIPCMEFHSKHIEQVGVYEITPDEYADFLCSAFDCWYNNGTPIISERFFDNMLSVYVHRESEMCTHRRTCSQTLVLEQNGDAFPCDFYIHPDWNLGNVGVDPLTDILSHPLHNDFIQLKPRLPERCKTCPWLDLCYGGCPRSRKWNDSMQESEPDYFCYSYRQVYAYAHERMKALEERVRNNFFQQGVNLYYNGKNPGRNDACACGSGLKYKHCCIDLN